MSIIDAEHEFGKRRNHHIAELMAAVDSRVHDCEFVDISDISEDGQERYEVRVKPYKAIEFIDISYEIVRD